MTGLVYFTYRMRYILLFIPVLIICCNQPLRKEPRVDSADTAKVIDTGEHPLASKNIPADETDTLEKFEYQTTPFPAVRTLPAIPDTAGFIKALKENCHLYEVHSTWETINYCKKIRIYGSDKPFYLVEYDYHVGATCAFPWKNQVVFDTAGKLIKVLSDIRVDIVKIFPGNNPFLLGVSSTGHGNGWHEVYRIRKDTLEQVYDGFIGNRPQTYSTGYDLEITEPEELPYTITDENKDGYNDIVFSGKVRYSEIDLGVQDKIVRVKYVFLYHKRNGHFIEKEDYSEKYAFIYGDSK